ncbi:MAG TPA: SRPBCC domain-containing protein [Candidatus Dormibacteraeota bacterium]|jgi:uncharacterized protein YndB with AHSA1/START domain
MQTSKDTTTSVLRITRTFPAKRERVFDAMTKPDQLAQWWGPAGFSLPTAELDLRVGGKYRFKMQPPQGQAMMLSGTFKEIDRPSKLAYTWAWEGAPETLVTIELKEAEGDTEVVLTHEPFPSAELVAQHDAGWQGGFERLEEILRRERASRR